MPKGSPKMRCEKCGGVVYVVETGSRDHVLVWRRRKCRECGDRFSTYEISVEDYSRMKKQSNNWLRLMIESGKRSRELPGHERSGITL